MHTKKLLAVLLTASVLGGSAFAQYVPSANDRMRVQTGSGPVHTVNAKSYIQTQAQAGGGSTAVNILGTSTGYTILKSGLTGSSNNTLTFPTTATDTIAALATAQTFTAAQTFSGGLNNTAADQLGGVTVANGTETPTATVGGTGSPTATLTANAGSKVIEFTLASASAATNIVVTPGFTAAHGFFCTGVDNTTSTERVIQNTALNTATATLTFFNAAGTATAPGATDVITVDCDAF